MFVPQLTFSGLTAVTAQNSLAKSGRYREVGLLSCTKLAHSRVRSAQGKKGAFLAETKSLARKYGRF